MIALRRNRNDKPSVKKYEGPYCMGYYQGKGRIWWMNGDSYEGDFVMGKRQGYGVYQWKDGKQYRGDYYDDMRHGWGTLVTDSNVYEGGFYRGKRHGTGHCLYKNGSKYYGEWNNGEYSGKGILICNDGYKYDGEWKGGLYNGHGVLISYGKIYEGEFLNGLAHGYGREIDSSSGEVIYEGQWIDGQSEVAIHKAAAAANKLSDLLGPQRDQPPSQPAHTPPPRMMKMFSSLSLSLDKPNTLSSWSSLLVEGISV